MKSRLTAGEARRIAIAAQGLAEPRPAGPVKPAQFRRMVDRVGLLQIDSVNVLTRAHYLPGFSRLGGYDAGLLEREAYGRRRSLFEYWGHEASLMPLSLQPLMRWRMARAEAGDGVWGGIARMGRERRDYIDAILAEIEKRGPVSGADFATGEKRAGGWWEWSDGKRALEWLFWAGFITTRTRRGFERVYDLTERVLPAETLATPTPREEDAHRALLGVAIRRLGVATEGDLRDYFRMPAAETKARVAELVEDGGLIPVAVEGWRQQAYLDPAARIGRKGAPGALLSPFDSMIWRRERTERLFGARIRLEIYTPAHKREHGYYVLPLLQDQAITARVDLKADRQAGVLRVQAAHLEPGADEAAAATALAAELQLMAEWLGLSGVQVNGRGDLAPALAHRHRAA